jgi:hypothetical protein
VFWPSTTAFTIAISGAVDNSGHMIENCLFIGGPNNSLLITNTGGITVRNSMFWQNGIRVIGALTAGQTTTVNNCLFYACSVAMRAVNAGEITENYNTLYGNTTDRTNVGTGANSNAYAPLFDTRWFHEAVNGGRFVTPFDMASYCELVEVADNAATATDMRGSSMVGAEREIGALEYDATLLIESAAGGGRRPRIRWHGV